MTYAIPVILLCLGAAWSFGRAQTDAPRIPITGCDGIGVLVAFIAFMAASAAFGSLLAFGMIIGVILHELGHVMGYRIAGDHGARFRMIPHLGGIKISDDPCISQLEAHFVSLMGAGLSLLIVVPAYCLAGALHPMAPAEAAMLMAVAMTVAAMNVVSLLPMLPLDGGMCFRLVMNTLCTSVGRFVPWALILSAAVAAMFVAAPFLIVLAVLALAAYLSGAKRNDDLPAMSRQEALLALGAHAATLAAHMTVGWNLFFYAI